MWTLALLPSPLLAGAVWAPVAAALGERGWPTQVVDLRPGLVDPREILHALHAALPDGDVVLVPHSNAGLYAPALAAGRHRPVVVYVDAALPLSEPDTPLAPPGLREHLAGLVEADGLLPPWTRWWDDADLEGLFPDAGWRARVGTAERRLPLAYFDATLPVPDGWAGRPSAYLAFGETYADETTRAEGAGWPTRVLPGRHLHLLHAPQAVADAVLDLLARLTVTGPDTPG